MHAFMYGFMFALMHGCLYVCICMFLHLPCNVMSCMQRKTPKVCLTYCSNTSSCMCLQMKEVNEFGLLFFLLIYFPII